MHCAKCGKRLMYNLKICPFCGEPVPAVQRKKAVIQMITLGILVVLTCVTSLLFIYYNQTAGPSSAARNFFLYFFTSSLFALVAFCLVVIIIDYVDFFIRKPIWGSVILVIILLLALCGYLFYRQYKFSKDIPAVLTVIQDQLSEAMAAKIMGDSIIAKRPMPGASMIRVEATSQQAANRLKRLRNSTSVPKRISGYLEVAIDWANDVASAARNEKQWGELGAEPNDFPLDLSEGQARQLVKISAEKIAELEEFADTAIARGDRDTMRYIAAKFLVQKHWLEGIIHSTKSWHSFVVFVPTALALEIERPDIKGPEMGAPLRPTLFKYGKTIRNICLSREPGVATFYCAEGLMQAADRLGRAAADFARGDEKTKEETKKGWEETKEETKEDLPPSQTGTAQSSPAVQNFYNECEKKGGKIGSTQVKKYLPTTELGYTCEYKEDNKSCWDYLTFSGGQYKGGEEGCPEQNLVPHFPEEKKSSQFPGERPMTWEEEEEEEEKFPEEWDGVYPYSATMQCTGNIPNLPPAIPVQGTITVTNNVGVDSGGTSFEIDESNTAQETLTYSEIQSQTGGGYYGAWSYVTIYYHFYQIGGKKMFIAYGVGVLGYSDPTGYYTANCTGATSATAESPKWEEEVPTAGEFDGFYAVEYDTSCKVSPPVGCGSDWSATGGQTYFSVMNNVVRDAYGQEAHIDTSGNAVIVRDASSGSHKIMYVTKLHFSKSGDKVTITGTNVSTDVSDSCTEICTETYTRTR